MHIMLLQVQSCAEHFFHWHSTQSILMWGVCCRCLVRSTGCRCSLYETQYGKAFAAGVALVVPRAFYTKYPLQVRWAEMCETVVCTAVTACEFYSEFCCQTPARLIRLNDCLLQTQSSFLANQLSHWHSVQSILVRRN